MNKNIRRITYAAISAAIVFIVTRIIYFPIGSSGAYINFGDVAIYFTACLLGGPIGAVASAVGSALSDLTLGYIIYAPATFIIKGLMGLAAGFIMNKGKFWGYLIACFTGGAIMTLGYAIYETFIFGFAVAIGNAPGNLIQWGGSVVIAGLLYPVAKRIKSTSYFEKL